MWVAEDTCHHAYECDISFTKIRLFFTYMHLFPYTSVSQDTCDVYICLQMWVRRSLYKYRSLFQVCTSLCKRLVVKYRTLLTPMTCKCACKWKWDTLFTYMGLFFTYIRLFSRPLSAHTSLWPIRRAHVLANVNATLFSHIWAFSPCTYIL